MSFINYCINKTIFVCNKLLNYCLDICKDTNKNITIFNSCYCKCIEDDTTNTTLCVHDTSNNQYIINIKYILVFSFIMMIMCYWICCKRNNEHMTYLLNNGLWYSRNNKQLHIHNNTANIDDTVAIDIDNNTTEKLPIYNQLDYYTPPNYLGIMYNVSSNQSIQSPPSYKLA